MADEDVTSGQPAEASPFLEYSVRTRQSTWAVRIFADGSAAEYTERGGWQPLPDLDGAAFDGLRDLVRDGGFLTLPAVIEPDGAVDDGSTLTFTITLAGRTHTVRASWPGSSPHPVLQRLNDEVQRVVGEALARVADEQEP